MENTYHIADKTIKIKSLYPYVHRYCIDYICDGEPDFDIETSQSDIEFERSRQSLYGTVSDRDDKLSDDFVEIFAVCRKISEQMPLFDTFLFHGSAVSVDGKAYIFAAPSGTGKSTHTRLWREILGDRAVMINDDKPFIKAADSGFIVYGSPWNGKHRLSTNTSAELKAICILERSETNSICRITSGEAFAILMNQVYRPCDINAARKTMQLFDSMIENVNLYRLKCNMNSSAALLSYNTMKEE